MEWRGTTHDFVLNWIEQVRQYDEIVGPAEALNEATLLCHLQDCVSQVPSLKNVEDTINIIAQGASSAGAALTPEQKYAQYRKHLLEACTTYDDKYKPSQHRRKLNYHSQQDDNIVFNSLTDIDTIEVYQSYFEPAEYDNPIVPTPSTPQAFTHQFLEPP